ncbi:MAG: hypothetical protein ACREAU_00755 [Nitrosopumilaceae archaeon]
MALVLTRPNPSTITGLSVVTINGQPTLVLEDTTRGNKKLSVAEQVLIFSESNLANNDWVQIGDAVDTDSGYVMDFNGTVVYSTGHCENTNANSKDIVLFINGISSGTLGTLIGGTDVQFINNTLDVDFVQGDKIRLQAQNGAGGIIEDSVIKLTVKWRGI